MNYSFAKPARDGGESGWKLRFSSQTGNYGAYDTTWRTEAIDGDEYWSMGVRGIIEAS